MYETDISKCYINATKEPISSFNTYFDTYPPRPDVSG